MFNAQDQAPLDVETSHRLLLHSIVILSCLWAIRFENTARHGDGRGLRIIVGDVVVPAGGVKVFVMTLSLDISPSLWNSVSSAANRRAFEVE